MKQLALLCLAVLVVVGAWFVFAGSGSSAGQPVRLFVPPAQATPMEMVRSADQLWKAAPGYYHASAVIDLLKLLTDSLGDEHWAAVSPAVYHAWSQHRGVVGIRPQLVALDVRLLPRLVKSGSAVELQGLMRAANEGSFDTTKLNEALLQAVEAPLPPAGWAGSRAEALAVAALVVDDITRTQDYLAKFKGSESPGVAAGLQRLNGILELREKFKTGRPELDALIKTWNAQGEDLLGRQSLRPLLEGLASGLVNENSTKVVPLNIGEYLTGTAAAPGAEEFWTRVLASMVPSLMTASDPKTNDFGVLAGLFEILFKKPGYAFTIWMRAAELQATTTPLDPTRATSFYERAWAAAINDEQRVRSAKLAIAGYMKVYEFVRARAVADATAKDLKDPAQKKLLDPVLAELNEKESKDAKRVAVQEKQIELNRRQGRLQNMKDLLVRAKRDKKPTEEIQALEQAVRDLEREVSE